MSVVPVRSRALGSGSMDRRCPPVDDDDVRFRPTPGGRDGRIVEPRWRRCRRRPVRHHGSSPGFATATGRKRAGGHVVSGVRVLVGTSKGAFILTADGTRDEWEVAGPLFGGWELYHL